MIQTRKKQIKISRKWSINIILLLTLVIILGAYKTQDVTIHQEEEKAQAGEIFSKIDDLAHIQFADMEARGNPSGFTGAETFMIIDEGYHKAKTIEEKLEWTKKMDEFFHRMDTYLHNRIGALTTPEEKERDKQYHDLDTAFDKLLLNKETQKKYNV